MCVLFLLVIFYGSVFLLYIILKLIEHLTIFLFWSRCVCHLVADVDSLTVYNLLVKEKKIFFFSCESFLPKKRKNFNSLFHLRFGTIIYLFGYTFTQYSIITKVALTCLQNHHVKKLENYKESDRNH